MALAFRVLGSKIEGFGWASGGFLQGGFAQVFPQALTCQNYS